MHWPLTEGAKRAVKLAAGLARFDDSPAIEPRHVLWALVLDESQAAEMLLGFDVTRSAIGDALPCEPGRLEVVASGPVELEEVVAIIDANLELQFLLREANARRNRMNGGEELNSLHLLWALCAVDSPAAEFLQRHGLSRDSFAPPSTTVGEPLEVDFELQWDEAAGSRKQVPETASESGRSSGEASPAVPGPQPSALRMIDAAANRAREGLRVVEDFTRFHLNDAHLSRELKECRHRLAAALQTVDSRSLLKLRDTPGDVGTAIETQAESRRESPLQVAAANFKRVQEALRSLEEFGKTISAEIGRQCETLRYRLYTLEQAVINTAVNRERLKDCRLYLLLTRSLCSRDPETVLREALAAGVDAVQVREKEMSDRDLLAWCKRVREIIDKSRAERRVDFSPHGLQRESDTPQSAIRNLPTLHSPLFIVNDRPDLAVLCRADGVHVGQDELPAAAVRRIVGPEMLVGVSTHGIEQARRAVLDGADYLGVGPVCPSRTKPFAELAGLDFVRQAAAEIALPWFAIGGIDSGNVEQVLAAGAARIAVSGAICAAADPRAAALTLREALESATG